MTKIDTKLIIPVKPNSVDLIFNYQCPHCQQNLKVQSITSPILLSCPKCTNSFPIVPVDKYCVNFIKIILNNGKSAIDPDFL